MMDAKRGTVDVTHAYCGDEQSWERVAGTLRSFEVNRFNQFRSSGFLSQPGMGPRRANGLADSPLIAAKTVVAQAQPCSHTSRNVL